MLYLRERRPARFASRRREMKQFAGTATLAAVALAAGVAAAAAQETIKVGVIQPLTGAFAASGNYVANGAKIAADEIKIGKADFLVVNNDWGRGAAEDFGKMFKEHNIRVGLVETMDPPAQDMSAQLAKIKASDADTLIITTAVEQLTLIFKQAAALGLKKRIITTGGSQNPDQLIEQAGAGANDTTHITFFTPWHPNVSADPPMPKAFVAEWNKRGYPFAGLTESFRGYDGIRTIAAAIAKAGKADPEAIRAAFWQIELSGMNGKIKFEKAGPAGQESGQSNPGIYLIKIENGKVVLPSV